MVYLLGANGKIGKNILNFLVSKKITFKAVTREACSGTLSFNQFLLTAPFEKNILIINSAILINDMNLLIDSFSNQTKMIHMSSVSVYGNTILSNKIAPINIMEF